MARRIRDYVRECSVCKSDKYDRHPSKPLLLPTSIPSYPCEIVQIDIFEIDKQKYLSALDKCSKFAKVFSIKNKSSIHFYKKLTSLLHSFSVFKVLVMDNERGFLTTLVLNYVRSLRIEVYQTPTQRSEANDEVDSLHSTLIEMYRCIADELVRLTPKERVSIAVRKRKPTYVFFSRSSRINYQGLVNFREETYENVKGT